MTAPFSIEDSVSGEGRCEVMRFCSNYISDSQEELEKFGKIFVVGKNAASYNKIKRNRFA